MTHSNPTNFQPWPRMIPWAWQTPKANWNYGWNTSAPSAHGNGEAPTKPWWSGNAPSWENNSSWWNNSAPWMNSSPGWGGNTPSWENNSSWWNNSAPWANSSLGWGGNSPSWENNSSWWNNSAPWMNSSPGWGGNTPSWENNSSWWNNSAPWATSSPWWGSNSPSWENNSSWWNNSAPWMNSSPWWSGNTSNWENSSSWWNNSAPWMNSSPSWRGNAPSWGNNSWWNNSAPWMNSSPSWGSNAPSWGNNSWWNNSAPWMNSSPSWGDQPAWNPSWGPANSNMGWGINSYMNTLEPSQLNLINGKWIPAHHFPNNFTGDSSSPTSWWNQFYWGNPKNEGKSDKVGSTATNGFIRYIDKVEEIKIELAMSGLSHKDFDITILGNELRLEVLSQSGQGERPAIFIPLPLSIELSKVNCKYKDDILTIHAPRQTELLQNMKKVKIA